MNRRQIRKFGIDVPKTLDADHFLGQIGDAVDIDARKRHQGDRLLAPTSDFKADFI